MMFHKINTLDRLLTNGDLIFKHFDGRVEEFIFKTEGELLKDGKAIYRFESVKIVKTKDDFKFIFQKSEIDHITTKSLNYGVRLL